MITKQNKQKQLKIIDECLLLIYYFNNCHFNSRIRNSTYCLWGHFKVCDVNCVKWDFQEVIEMSIMTLNFFLGIKGSTIWQKKKKKPHQEQLETSCQFIEYTKKNGMRKKIDVYLSLSTGLKPGRMCLKLLFLSSLGWLLVRFIEPFNLRLKNP